jgi:hypothetical protein
MSFDLWHEPRGGRMKPSVTFQMDALEGTDTNPRFEFGMALEAQRRGHQLYH